MRAPILGLQRPLGFRIVIAVTAVVLCFGAGWLLLGQSEPPPGVRIIARGAGATLLEGGSGPPEYIPVLTKVAFHVELVGGLVNGAFECLAQASSKPTGPASADFGANIMYVTGKVHTAAIEGDAIRISGGSECTGIGAGSNVPFSALIRKGGPGATLVLTAGSPPQLFKEILLDGSFEIAEQRSVGMPAHWLTPLFRLTAPVR